MPDPKVRPGFGTWAPRRIGRLVEPEGGAPGDPQPTTILAKGSKPTGSGRSVSVAAPGAVPAEQQTEGKRPPRANREPVVGKGPAAQKGERGGASAVESKEGRPAAAEGGGRSERGGKQGKRRAGNRGHGASAAEPG